MKSVVIVGTGADVIAASDLLNPQEMKLVGIADPREEAWNVFNEDGSLRDEIEGLPIAPVEVMAAYEPDVMFIASRNTVFCDNMKYLLLKSGYNNEVMLMTDFADILSVTGAVLRRISRRLQSLGIEGAIAELGCFRGDISWQLNALMPDRKLYLFDTFTGFDARDVRVEKELECSDAEEGRFGPVRPERLMERMPAAENVVLREGWFPEAAFDLEDEKFAFAYLDARLYQPTLSALEFFFPRMSQGGMILVKGTVDEQYQGVARALQTFEEKYGAFLIVPLGDMDESIIIVKA